MDKYKSFDSIYIIPQLLIEKTKVLFKGGSGKCHG